MPKKVLVLVEGQTEERFVRGALGRFLAGEDAFLTPIVIKTKRELRGPDHKGGVTSYKQVKRDLLPLLNDTSADIVTTMIDYYAIPSDFPGFAQRPIGTCYERVEFMEEQFKIDVNHTKFIPYLQLHEFEALVFASEDKLPIALVNKDREIRRVAEVNSEFASPEEINENPDSAPSKRLKAIFPEYQKTFHSQLILSQSSIEDLRSKCKHFNSWLLKLEH